MRVPEYTDGALELYEITQDESKDYPEVILKPKNMSPIWYREISVFDRLKYEFNQGGKEITMKIRVPKYKGISSNNVCVIDGIKHKVFNATHVTSKEGFPETELTLVSPEEEMRIQ
ncbi:hypothetical protein [Faecalimonas sp.]